MAKRIDLAAAAVLAGTTYPPPYDEPCRARLRTRLGDAAGLTQFGVNLLRLPPAMFTPVFAVARTVGWVAHWNEMMTDPETRIVRPRQLYVGATERPVA
ncbi:MAG TPA: citrate/2-methylcitrate synthase, partial [Stellaceae bacterium]|nr:citrate/2-methylcitrate synthase [Stellaceae bacterium]